MPRKALRNLNGIRQRFHATIARRSYRNGYRGSAPVPTILLANIADANTGELLTDHIWIDEGIWGKAIPTGAHIAFNARVGQYRKGYRGNRADAYDAPPPSVDWHLTRPTNIRLLNAAGEWTAAPRPATEELAPASCSICGKPTAGARVCVGCSAQANAATSRQLEYLAALRQAAGQPALTPDSDLTKDQAGDLITELVANTPRPQCAGTTLAGHRCRNLVGYAEQYCGRHSAAGEEAKANAPARAVRIPANRCQATTIAGQQCKKAALGDQQFCRAHTPTPPPPPLTPSRCQGTQRNGKPCRNTPRQGHQLCRPCARILSNASD